MNISLTFRVIPLAALLVAGCSNTSSRQPVKPIATPLTSQQQAEQERERAASEQARIESCRQALDSLKEVNPQQATKLSNDFNALVRAASQYNSVREKVADPTRLGIDSMYQFKSIKLCADIQKTLIDSLVQRGESKQP
ncbi:hypothetical protein [Klebsiella pneumoniae]|uniref:hypothetical protein n=1 Tax=Klebsiella pneumoniae TaxID=573 RepID=UPI0010F7D316|nr:hypothetical protein [Klebsiella pneumoniae]